MIKHLRLIPLLLFTLACGINVNTASTKSSADPTGFTFTSASLAPTAIASPTPRFQFDDGQRSVAYDFTAHLCDAKWLNSADPKSLPCPGSLDNSAKGYIGLLSGIEQGLASDFVMILAKPANDGAGGIFGRYPAFQVLAADEFRASLTCRTNLPCAVEFSLGYYDENGEYVEPYPAVSYHGSGDVINFVLPLHGLANKTVEFVLVVRNIGDPASAWALWVAPRIVRP